MSDVTGLPDDLDRLLGERDVVTVEGADALTYLHSQVSQDLNGQEVGEQRWTFILEPTGKIAGLARVTRVADDGYALDTDAGFGESLLARINRFKIRVAAETSLTVAPPQDSVAEAAVEAERVRAGWPRLGVDIELGEAIPGGTGLSPIAVSYTKGCYPGQELVERMDSRAALAPKSLRRLVVAEGTAPGDPILDGEKDVGVITSVAGTAALGWVKRSSELGDVVIFGPAER